MPWRIWSPQRIAQRSVSGRSIAEGRGQVTVGFLARGSGPCRDAFKMSAGRGVLLTVLPPELRSARLETAVAMRV